MKGHQDVTRGRRHVGTFVEGRAPPRRLRKLGPARATQRIGVSHSGSRCGASGLGAESACGWQDVRGAPRGLAHSVQARGHFQVCPCPSWSTVTHVTRETQNCSDPANTDTAEVLGVRRPAGPSGTDGPASRCHSNVLTPPPLVAWAASTSPSLPTWPLSLLCFQRSGLPRPPLPVLQGHLQGHSDSQLHSCVVLGGGSLLPCRLPPSAAATETTQEVSASLRTQVWRELLLGPPRAGWGTGPGRLSGSTLYVSVALGLSHPVTSVRDGPDRVQAHCSLVRTRGRLFRAPEPVRAGTAPTPRLTCQCLSCLLRPPPYGSHLPSASPSLFR